MKINEANRILDTKEMLRRWEQEIEDKVNHTPRKITQTRYAEEKCRLSLIQYIISLFENEIRNCSCYLNKESQNG